MQKSRLQDRQDFIAVSIISPPKKLNDEGFLAEFPKGKRLEPKRPGNVSLTFSTIFCLNVAWGVTPPHPLPTEILLSHSFLSDTRAFSHNMHK